MKGERGDGLKKIPRNNIAGVDKQGGSTLIIPMSPRLPTLQPQFASPQGKSDTEISSAVVDGEYFIVGRKGG